MKGPGPTAWLALAGAVMLTAGCSAAQDRAELVARGRGIFSEQGCHGCHTVGVSGTPLATDLTRIGARSSEAELARWLRDPAVHKPTAQMPRIRLEDAEVTALAAYLASLR